MTLLMRVLALAVVMMLGVACGGGDDATEAAADGGSASETSEEDAGGAGALTASGFAFSPADLTAASGDSIEFTNEDDAPHTFTAKKAKIDVSVDPMGSATIDLAGVEAGSYDFLCKLHPNMKGTLEVTE